MLIPGLVVGRVEQSDWTPQSQKPVGEHVLRKAFTEAELIADVCCLLLGLP